LLLDFDGVTSLRLASDGALLLATSAGELRWQRPIAYQVIGGKRRPVDCAYRVRMRHQVGFEIGSYDRSLPLTIDPTFEYSTALPDVQVHALQVDGFGQTYVAGYSPNGLTGGNDIYVSKLNNAGSSAFFTTYLGGRGDDRALGLALDYAGSIHLTGRTNSPNFPVVGATQSTLGGDFDASNLLLAATRSLSPLTTAAAPTTRRPPSPLTRSTTRSLSPVRPIRPTCPSAMRSSRSSRHGATGL